MYVYIISKEENSMDRYNTIIIFFQQVAKSDLSLQIAYIQCKGQYTNIVYPGGKILDKIFLNKINN